MKFYENSSGGNRVVPCGWVGGRTDEQAGRQTDKHDEANSHVSHFVNAHNNRRNLSLAPILLYSYISHTSSSFHSHVHITISINMYIIKVISIL
jgi:hypothetical protein